MLASSRVKATGPPRTPLALSVRLVFASGVAAFRASSWASPLALSSAYSRNASRAAAQPVECWGVDAKAHAVARLAEAAVEFGHVAGDVQLRFAWQQPLAA